MNCKRPGRWAWVGLACCGVLYQGAGCFSFDLIRQVLADQVALTAATLSRGLVGGFFGIFGL